MAPPIGVQLYSVRDQLDKDFEGTMKKIADIGFDGVEAAGQYGESPQWFRGLCDDLGLRISSMHTSLPGTEEGKDAQEFAEILGIKDFVIPYIPAEKMQTRALLGAMCDEFNAALDKFPDYRFTYHNHDWEFRANADGEVPHLVMRELLDPRFKFEVDAYWVKVGGFDPVETASELGTRAPLWHIKDGMLTGPMLPVGDGVLDYASVIPKLTHAEWLIVELDNCATDMIEAIRRSYNFLAVL